MSQKMDWVMKVKHRNKKGMMKKIYSRFNDFASKTTKLKGGVLLKKM